ncbi:AEC family transporter [Halovulum sp. GXIMD14793]
MLLDVVLPVFIIIGAGYGLTKAGLFRDEYLDGLVKFSQNIAIPCLLFRAAMNLDLSRVFDPRLLFSFYAGAATTFAIGIIGARLIFGKRPGEAVAIGFGSLFSNSVILGVPIVTLAFGGLALDATFAIVSIHAPFCYLLGITVMEISRADGRGPAGTAKAVLRAMLKNALMIGLLLGFAANFSGLELPKVGQRALEMMVAAALPTALFSLGGVLTRYRIRSAIGPALMTSALSLIAHPAIAYTLSHHILDLPPDFVRAATLTAAMPPGVNTYVFATMYNRSEDIAASTVLLATGLALLSVPVWLNLLHAL